MILASTATILDKHKPHRRKPGHPLRFGIATYQRRDVVERSIEGLKQARRVATRFEKLAVNFLAMLELAMIQRYFRTFLRDRT